MSAGDSQQPKAGFLPNLFKTKPISRAKYEEEATSRFSFLQRDYLKEYRERSDTSKSSDTVIAAAAAAIPAPPSNNPLKRNSMICFGSREAIELEVSYDEADDHPHVIRIEQTQTTTDLLYMCMKEFSRKSIENDPRCYMLRAQTRASTVASEYHPDSNDASSDPSFIMWPLVPLWLYSLQNGDKIKLVRIPRPEGSNAPPKINLYAESWRTTVMIVLEEANYARATVTVSTALNAEALVQAINEFKWEKIGVQYKPIDKTNLHYYTLFTWKISSWAELPANRAMIEMHLPELSILVLKRRDIVELKYTSAAGPFSDFFSTDVLDKRIAAAAAAAHESGTKRRDETYKIIIPYTKTIHEAEGIILKWVQSSFGVDFIASIDEARKREKQEHPESAQPAVSSKKVLSDDDEDDDDFDFEVVKGPMTVDCDDEIDVVVDLSPKVVRRASSNLEVIGLVDDSLDAAETPGGSNDNVEVIHSESAASAEPAAGAVSQPPVVHSLSPVSEIQWNKSISKIDREFEEIMENAKGNRQKRLNSASQNRIEEPAPEVTVVNGDLGESTRLQTNVNTPNGPSITRVAETYSETIQASLTVSGRGGPPMMTRIKKDGKLLIEGTIASHSFSPDENVELRYHDTVLQFSVSYTPQSSLSDIHVDNTNVVMFDGEVTEDTIKNVLHMYQPYQSEKMRFVRGTLTVTSYKLVFKPDENETGTSIIRLPLGMIQSAAKSNVGEMMCVNLNCKNPCQMSFVMGTRQDRRKFIRYLEKRSFVGNSVERLFAFSLRMKMQRNGWNIFDMEKEYMRLGVTTDRSQPWHVTHVNSDYNVCASYPSVLAVPSAVSDGDVLSESTARSQHRFPVLTWLSEDGVSLTRAAQPSVSLIGSHSKIDQQYLDHIRKTNPVQSDQLFILDSRPKANAIGNRTRGGGYESTGGSEYAGCKLEFENIPNIHVVRESYNRVKALCQTTSDESTFLTELDTSRWMDMTCIILTSVLKTVNLIANFKTSVILHCSDGWDRTSQCCALSELCLDPYYRTLDGFIILIEKDWLAFGHRFATRHGVGCGKFVDQQSPIFFQFIFCVYQLLRQFPRAFQFNEYLLLTIAEHIYSNLFGTFLCNCERERKDLGLASHTKSLWTYIFLDYDKYINPIFDALKSPVVLRPDPSVRSLHFWHNYFMSWFRQLDHRAKSKSGEERNIDVVNELQAAYSKEKRENERLIRENKDLDDKVTSLEKQIAALKKQLEEQKPQQGATQKDSRQMNKPESTPSKPDDSVSNNNGGKAKNTGSSSSVEVKSSTRFSTDLDD